MQAREGQLHLGLDPHRPRDGQVRRRLDQVLQQRRLPDPGLAPQDQRPALAPADVVDQAVQQGALVGPPEQAHRAAQPPTDRPRAWPVRSAQTSESDQGHTGADGRDATSRLGHVTRPPYPKGDPHELHALPSRKAPAPSPARRTSPPGSADTFTSRYIDTGDAAPARRHRRRRPAAAAGARLARDLVRVAPADAGAGPGLRGHRGRPARHRAVRQARGRLRHRHPRRRPGRADGRARPRAVRRGRPRHRLRDQLRAGRGPPGPGRPRGPRRDPRAPRARRPHRPLFVPAPLNDRLWHIPFNRVEKLPEQLVTGREDVFFGYEFAHPGRDAARRGRSTTTSACSPTPTSLRGSFGFYRALDATIAQNEQRKSRPLTDARPGDRRRGELRRARRARR